MAIIYHYKYNNSKGLLCYSQIVLIAFMLSLIQLSSGNFPLTFYAKRGKSEHSLKSVGSYTKCDDNVWETSCKTCFYYSSYKKLSICFN